MAAIARTAILVTIASRVYAACPGGLTPSYRLNVASGYTAEPVLKGLSTPRGITMDSEGHLIVAQRGLGISAHVLDVNGCVTSSKTIISNTAVNHGIEISTTGTKLFASSPDIVWSWDYNASTMTATNQTPLVTGMNHAGHNTRTVIQSKADPNYLIVSNGSSDNLDIPSYYNTTGRATVKSFDMRTIPSGGVNYVTGGRTMVHGVRNDVGLVEDKAGNVLSVENSADNMQRTINGNAVDVHNNNPAELLYNLGTAAAPLGRWGGYPYCFRVWDPPSFADKTFTPGDLFVQVPNATVNDDWCTQNVYKHTLLLPPHTAPLDIKLGVGSDTSGYVSFHGSWNRSPPIGYKVVKVPGSVAASGAWTPTASPSSTTGFTDLLWNTDATQCQSGCFRPVGLVFDTTGNNLYVSSDTTGEIFLVKKTA